MNHLRTYFTSDFKASFESEHDLEHTIQQVQHLKSFNLVMTYGGGAYNSARYLPHQIHAILQCSPLPEAMYAYWWRAVTATYIARPNNDTYQLLMQYEHKTFYDNQQYGLGSAAKSVTKESKRKRRGRYLTAPNIATAASSPSFRGNINTTAGNGKKRIFDGKECIAMFVRHGDKGIEMKLIEFIKYYQTAQQLWNAALVPESSKLMKPKLHGLEHYHNWTEIVTLKNDNVPQNGKLFDVVSFSTSTVFLFFWAIVLDEGDEL